MSFRVVPCRHFLGLGMTRTFGVARTFGVFLGATRVTVLRWTTHFRSTVFIMVVYDNVAMHGRRPSPQAMRSSAPWSSVPAGTSACMVELARQSRYIYHIERVSRLPNTRSRGPAGSTRGANTIDARPFTSTHRSSGAGAGRPHAYRPRRDFAIHT